ncbi:S41 family peptidase [Kineosporia sp. J2-2]|uniref:S41 family peptidase n=1 Tax=Kineosporia corallincola TaxID=2835133 RepID=A0ABS5TGE3_9ACTN|nr:S41 family peptidase [Kineosporia corallincola]MBT0770163.1 S41 family peptidase [Kineosporia corallincola]
MSTPVISEALALLRARYIFPEKAERAASLITGRHAAGAYDGLTDTQLAEQLTAALFEVCADHHLRVRVRVRRPGTHPADPGAAWRETLRVSNFGISRVELLEGNIGYLDLRLVADAGSGGRAMAAAMELVSHTDALIIDLRRNHGGAPDGVAFWNSFLFPDDSTHLNSVYQREDDVTRQYWTLAHLPVQRYLDRPVHVLIGAETFSAGEEFAYNLQCLGRATLIGRRTRGGAHPCESFPLTPQLEITVPIARSVNPVTGTNWEGVGVQPDLDVPEDEALDVAVRAARG